jgi:pilus assembly protein TadC
MIGYLIAGLWTRTVTHYYLISLPVAIVALFIGRIVNHRLSGDAFLKYVYAGLACIGVILFAQVIAGCM